MMLVKMFTRQTAVGRRCVVLSRVRNVTCTVAITRDIDDSLVKAALTLNPGSQSTINLDLARAQHSRLNEELKKAGVTVHSLKSGGYPDSVFIEDTAVIIGNTALITNPGADSRKGEVAAVREYLKNNFKQLKVVDLPKGTVDGGDILFTGKVIIAGLTARTNAQGAAGLQVVFPALPVVTVDVAKLTATARKQAVLAHRGEGSVEEVLHLKSICSMCTEKTILVGGRLGSALQEELRRNPIVSAQHDFIHVPDMAAANCVLVNTTLLRRTTEEFPASDAVLNALVPRRIRQVEVAGGELAKVDGALSCCSLLF